MFCLTTGLSLIGARVVLIVLALLNVNLGCGGRRSFRCGSFIRIDQCFFRTFEMAWCEYVVRKLNWNFEFSNAFILLFVVVVSEFTGRHSSCVRLLALILAALITSLG